MEFTAIQIATFLGGIVEGDPEVKVYNVAKIEEGAPGMLSFLANPKYEQYLYTTQSSIVLINNDLQLQDKVSATLIRVPDAYAAFAQLLGLYQQFMQSKSGVSSLSFISKDATYGEDVYIGEFAFIGERAKIGNRVKIYPQVYIGDDVVIGDDTVIEGKYEITTNDDDETVIVFTFEDEDAKEYSGEFKFSEGEEDGKEYIKLGIVKYTKVD